MTYTLTSGRVLLSLSLLWTATSALAAPYRLTNNNLAANAQQIIRESDGASIPDCFNPFAGYKVEVK